MGRGAERHQGVQGSEQDMSGECPRAKPMDGATGGTGQGVSGEIHHKQLVRVVWEGTRVPWAAENRGNAVGRPWGFRGTAQLWAQGRTRKRDPVPRKRDHIAPRALEATAGEDLLENSTFQ